MKNPSMKRLSWVLLLVLTASACKSGRLREDPILRLSSAEALAQGKKLFEARKYNRARPFLSHAFEVEPNSAGGREALLMVADCYFETGSQADLIQAEAKYRDFQNRFPTSPRASYVQYRIAQSLANRIEKPQRDQSPTLKAKTALEELLRLYPTSEYAPAAREKLDEVHTRLAEHEYLVGHFYLRYGLPGSAATRLEGLLRDYPGTQIEDKALFYLGRAYEELQRSDDAQATWNRLQSDHPKSPWIAKIPAAKGTSS